MTVPVTTTGTVDGGDTPLAVPPPPPRPVQEEDKDYVDPVTGGAVQKAWDIALVYGPAIRAELHAHRPESSHNWREYLRYHEEISRTKDPSRSDLHIADRWAFDQALDQCLERGWLVTNPENTDQLMVGICPPSHKPLQTIGGEFEIRALFAGLSEDRAREILEHKIDVARVKPHKEGYDRLLMSISTHGLLTPITVWQISPSRRDFLIVDGVTRAEICASLDIELDYDNPHHYHILPEGLTANEALTRRVQYEVVATTKPQTEKSREALIKRLEAEGWDIKAIAAEVRLTDRHVRRILSTADTHVRRGQTRPTEDDVAEFVALSDAGWPVRDIAKLTQWGKSVISKHLVRTEAEAEPGKTSRRRKAKAAGSPLPAEGTIIYLMLVTLMFDMPDSHGTQREVFETAGQEHGSVASSFANLERNGLIHVIGKGAKNAKLYEPTSLAWELIPERPATIPLPAPAPASTSKTDPEPETSAAPVLTLVPARNDLDEAVTFIRDLMSVVNVKDMDVLVRLVREFDWDTVLRPRVLDTMSATTDTA